MKDDMDLEMSKVIAREVQTMSQLKQHPNVIYQIEHGTDDYIKFTGKSRKVKYIALELANGGELFNYLANTGRLEEPLARQLFHQFMEGLSHCHDNGITHRDLKPENLIMDD